MYDIVQDEWHNLPSLNIARSTTSVCIIENIINNKNSDSDSSTPSSKNDNTCNSIVRYVYAFAGSETEEGVNTIERLQISGENLETNFMWKVLKIVNNSQLDS